MSDASPRHDPFGFGRPNAISVVRIAVIPAIVALIVQDTDPARRVAAA